MFHDEDTPTNRFLAAARRDFREKVGLIFREEQ
jgi:hypothetical protein